MNPDTQGTKNKINFKKTFPSGSEKKREREEFYNGDVARLLMHSSDDLVLAGDFMFLRPPIVRAH